jgi:Ca2+/H+ antiporter, TMEM165/GDT1 family
MLLVRLQGITSVPVPLPAPGGGSAHFGRSGLTWDDRGVEAVLVAFGTIFVAELGDKSQFVALGMAARGRALAVLAGITVAVAVLQALAVGVGIGLANALPERPVEIGSGLVFVGVGGWTLLRPDTDDEEDTDESDALPNANRTALAVATTAGAAFFLAEFGDKTQLATLALASANGALATWIGATLGQVGADVLAVIVGAKLGSRLPTHAIRKLSGALFVFVGVLLLAGVG